MVSIHLTALCAHIKHENDKWRTTHDVHLSLHGIFIYFSSGQMFMECLANAKHWGV